MRSQIEGSQAVARAVAHCRPDVICAYPITPQTHIVESLNRLVKLGELAPCEFVNVESEFAALSVAIGASAAGARSYTATSSQGLLFMAEALYNAAGLGLPIVMTVANRALGAPINIWNDQSDSLSQRDAGWIQLYAGSNQEAVDMHLQAFRIAEELSVPVMVCMDGFVLTHAVEPVDVPDQRTTDEFLPRYRPALKLDPDQPVTIGALVGPEAYTEVRYLAYLRHQRARSVIAETAAAFAQLTGRSTGGLTTTYRLEDAQIAVIALGSVLGTLQDAVDDLRDDGTPAGVLGIRSFRPFPRDEVRMALRGADRIIVLERALAPGGPGIVTADVRAALGELPVPVHSVIAGLGGRPVTRVALRQTLERAATGDLAELTFLDLKTSLIERDLAHLGSA